MNAARIHPKPLPRIAVEEIVADHGLRPVVLALIALALRGKRGPAPRPPDLPDHLRRDVGLNPLPQGRKYWELH